MIIIIIIALFPEQEDKEELISFLIHLSNWSGVIEATAVH
jgi:hypothetical protein